MHVLCTHIDAGTNTILPAFQPSLTQLAAESGRDRRTVERDLNVLERRGWVIRRRPSIHDARTKHARTNYTVRIPEARDESPSDARGSKPRALGGGKRGAGGHGPLRSSAHLKSSADELHAIIEAIRARTGVEVDNAWAERVRDQVVGGRHVADASAYVSAAIARAPADTYVPTPQPPAAPKMPPKPHISQFTRGNQ